MSGASRCDGFTLVEALASIAILGIALVPILSASRRIMVSAQQGERRAALAETAESRLSAAGARLVSMRRPASGPPASRDAAGAREWRDSGTADGIFWNIHARPVESAGGVTRWRIEATARDPDGNSETTFREHIEPDAPAAGGGEADVQ